MSKNKISFESLENWRKEEYQTFCSESVACKNNRTKRLLFQLNMNGVFKVSLGSEVVYKGYNFKEAKEAYEAQG